MDLEALTALLHSCGAPMVAFIVGLFFPQVKLSQVLSALSPKREEQKP